MLIIIIINHHDLCEFVSLYPPTLRNKTNFKLEIVPHPHLKYFIINQWYDVNIRSYTCHPGLSILV